MKKILLILIAAGFGVGIVTGGLSEKSGAQQFSCICRHNETNVEYPLTDSMIGSLDISDVATCSDLKTTTLNVTGVCAIALPSKCLEQGVDKCGVIFTPSTPPPSNETPSEINFVKTFGSEYGNKCSTNYANCPSGKVNLREQIELGTITVHQDYGLNKQSAVGNIRYLMNEVYNRKELCVDNSQYEIIPIDAGNSDIEGYFGIDSDNDELNYRRWYPTIQEQNDVRVFDAYIAVCDKGWHGMESPKTYFDDNDRQATRSITPWGCCPSGYTFITEDSRSDPGHVIQGYSACCKDISGYELSTYDSKENIFDGNGECTYRNIATREKMKIDETSSIENAPIIRPQILGSSLIPKNDSPIGLTYSDSLSTKELVCDRSTENRTFSCALNQEGKFSNSTIFNSASDSTSLCSSCFTAGSPVGIAQIGEGNTTQLVLCKSDGTPQFENLINNSVNDTLVYLRTDIENRDALQACRERGGIYIFVGCVDPTPLGVITGLIRITLGVVGGVALLQLIWIGILLQSGQEKQIAAARKNLMATLTGVAVLVFSILILRIIGVNVLDILPAGSV